MIHIINHKLDWLSLARGPLAGCQTKADQINMVAPSDRIECAIKNKSKQTALSGLQSLRGDEKVDLFEFNSL